MRLSAATTALIVLFLVAFTWLALLQYMVLVQQDSIRILRSVSVGLSRDAVVGNLGPPARVYDSDEGEVLVYPSAVRPISHPTFVVVVDSDDRAASVRYLTEP